MDRRTVALLALVVAACEGREPARPSPDLAVYLHGVAGTPETTRLATVRGWRLDHAAWTAVVAEPYHPLYEAYVRAFEAAVPALAAQLARPRPIVARAHFAGDPLLTRDQAITRWALPTLAESRVAELAGRPPLPIEAVFVTVGGRWRAIVGIAAILRARIAAIDPACAPILDELEPAGGRCIEAAWAVGDAALRDDRDRFMHACRLATTLCGKRSP